MAQELYELPEGWEWKSWLDVLDIINGKNQKEVLTENGDYPIMGSGGEMARASEFLTPAYSTIVGRKGTINRPFFVKEPFWNVDTAFGISAKDGLNRKFLHFFCLSFNFETLNKSTTLPSLTKKDLYKIQIPVPPLEEQKRIVAQLDALFSRIDQSIAQLQHTLAQTKALKQSAYNETFDKLGTPEVELGTLVDFYNGYAFKSKDFSDDGIPVLRISNIQSGGIDYSRMAYIPNDLVTSKIEPFYIEPNDILIAMSGATTGKVAINNSGERLLQNQRVGRLVAKNETLRKFVYIFLETKVSDNLKQALGAAQPNLSTKQIKELKIPLPPLPEQEKIVAQLDALSERTQALETATTRQLEQLKALKASLLDAAFRGEL